MAHEDAITFFRYFLTMPKRLVQILPHLAVLRRSFSAFRRIKTYFRAAMGQRRLLDIEILNIEREITNVL